MDNLKKKLNDNKGSIIVLAIILVLVFVYYWFFMREGSGNSPLIYREVRTEAAEIGREFVEEIRRLQDLDKVNLDILEDPSVANMEDISLRIIPEPLGKPNPFAPF